MCQEALSTNTGQSVEMLFKLLGWKFAEDGDKAGSFSPSFTALGVEINLGNAHNGSVEFANTEKRKTELVETITNILQKGALTVVESQRLRGRMQFMDGQLFGRLGRLCMRAITDHAFIKKQVKLDCSTRVALERFLIFLEHAKPRQLHTNSGMPWFIYTDACYEPKDTSWPCGLGGVLVNSSGEAISFFSACLSVQHMSILGAKAKKTIIFEAELLALVLAFAVWKNSLEAAPLICFVDNNSARDVAISGAGRNATARALVGFLLKLEMAVCAAPWYSRVPTPSNIADDPSRGEIDKLVQEGVKQTDPAVELSQIMEVLVETSDMKG